jgi:hypothetical protein
MADEPPAVVGVATLFDGFEQAFARWQEVERATHDPLQTFVPLFEVLEWTACIDERLELKTWLSSPNVRGLRWSRNRCHHDWALALEVRSWDQWKLRPNMEEATWGARRMDVARATARGPTRPCRSEKRRAVLPKPPRGPLRTRDAQPCSEPAPRPPAAALSSAVIVPGHPNRGVPSLPGT